jgi:LmbE family N-acetylglucosaminyl deacetylase
MTYTLVSFHAHPDDEALLTAGTLARAAAEGHRVVVVVATSGGAGLAAGDPDAATLARVREEELAASARALGVARVVLLGHPDSGLFEGQRVDDGRVPFCELDPELVAIELAAVLEDEDADVLTTYDAAGGYGHPDHLQVHRVGQRAAELSGTPVVLEATVDRDLLLWATRLLRASSRVLSLPWLPDLTDAFTPHAELTHLVDVRPHLDAKVRSLGAHASQGSGGDSVRTLALLLRLPRRLRRRVLGTEWFREVGRVPDGRLLDDVFASCRESASVG